MAAAALNNHLNMATDQPHLLLAEFRQAGFVVCGPLAPAALSTVRSAFHANQADHKKAWLAIDEPNRQAYFDLDDHHDAGSFLRHPAWLSLLDHPTTAGLVTDVCGAGARFGFGARLDHGGEPPVLGAAVPKRTGAHRTPAARCFPGVR